MKSTLTPVALSIACTLGLTACGGSSSNSSTTPTPPTTPTYTLSGKTVGIQTGTACIDANKNWQCDAGEISTPIQDGKFTFTSKDINIQNHAVVANTTTPAAQASARATAGSNLVLSTPAAGAQNNLRISVISSMINASMQASRTQDQATKLLMDALKKVNGVTLDNQNLLTDDITGMDTFETAMQGLFDTGMSDTSASQISLGSLSLSLSLSLLNTLVDDHNNNKDIRLNLADIKQSVPQTKIQLTDTGVTTFSDGTKHDLTAEPADLPGQDASYDNTLNLDKTQAFKYQKLDAQGQPLADDATQWSCVKELATGLIWEVKVDDKTNFRHKSRRYAFYDGVTDVDHQDDIQDASCKEDSTDNFKELCTTEQYITRVNTEGLCGLKNWRLPTFNEQLNLVDYSLTETIEDKKAVMPSKYFNDQYYESYQGTTVYWSSTFDAARPITEMLFVGEAPNQTHRRAIKMVHTLDDESGGTYSEVMGFAYTFPIRLVSGN